MNVIWFASLFYLGCCLTSFLTLIGMRIPRYESIVFPRSHCENCQHSLSIRDLFPIFSFLIQKGHCRYCGINLPFSYMLMEIIGGSSFLVVITCFIENTQIGMLLFLLWIFGVIFTVTDIFYLLLPNSIMRVFFLSALLLRLIWDSSALFDYLISGTVIFGLLLVLYYVYPEGIGGGDVKLFGVIGLLLGFQQTIAAIFLASFFGLLFGLIDQKTKTGSAPVQLPFGPFIFLGTFLAVLAEQLIDPLAGFFFLSGP